MAMVMVNLRREEATLVRVHVIDPLRDLVGAEYSGPSNWTLWAALQRVAEEGRGVVVVLANHESSQALLERVQQLTQAPRQFSRSQSRIYSEVGTGGGGPGRGGGCPRQRVCHLPPLLRERARSHKDCDVCAVPGTPRSSKKS